MNPVRVRAAVGTARRRVVHVLLRAVVLLPTVALTNALRHAGPVPVTVRPAACGGPAPGPGEAR